MAPYAAPVLEATIYGRNARVRFRVDRSRPILRMASAGGFEHSQLMEPGSYELDGVNSQFGSNEPLHLPIELWVMDARQAALLDILWEQMRPVLDQVWEGAVASGLAADEEASAKVFAETMEEQVLTLLLSKPLPDGMDREQFDARNNHALPAIARRFIRHRKALREGPAK